MGGYLVCCEHLLLGRGGLSAVGLHPRVGSSIKVEVPNQPRHLPGVFPSALTEVLLTILGKDSAPLHPIPSNPNLSHPHPSHPHPYLCPHSIPPQPHSIPTPSHPHPMPAVRFSHTPHKQQPIKPTPHASIPLM